MAKIVAAMTMIHNPRITGAPDAAPSEQAHAVHLAFDTLRRDLETASPDWALVITNEHLNNPFYPYMPPLTVGVAPRFQSIEELRNGLKSQVVPSNETIAAGLLAHAWDHGVDLAYSHDMLVDHGTMVPLRFLTPNNDLPVVHIHQATARSPRPPLQRCYQLGRVLGDFIESRPTSERVAVIGTGGLSHWVGNPRMGQVNAAWDRHVLSLFERRCDAEILAMTDADITEAGNGAHEIRNWVTVAGVVPGWAGEIVGHVEHIRPWAMGSAHMRFHAAR